MKNSADVTFLQKLKKEIDDNLNNAQFSVEELAKKIGMSRSQLHRRLNTATGQSVSQFIREYRLQLGMALLKEGELTAAEVADRVGFGSATYFNKCFNEYYGFPPGEVKNKPDDFEVIPNERRQEASVPDDTKKYLVPSVIGLAAMVIIALLFFKFTKENEANFADKSIAILPFKNLSEDQQNEYFAEGVIEAIRTQLSEVGELRVISRTSVEQYRDNPKPTRDIAKELAVSTLLEGSIQRNNNKVRIEVRLVDGKTEEQLWAKTYDKELEDVFAIQNEIAQSVATELNAQLSPEEKNLLSKSDTENPKAYDLYLKAIYEYRTYTNSGTHNSIDLLEQVIILDPNYARAYAALANSYIGLATIFGAELSALEAFEKGKPLIDKALQLDADLDEAHMLMGFYLLYNNWNFEGAEAEYKLAIASDYADALAVYADYLNFVRRHTEAMAIAERLNITDPYYPNTRMVLSYIYSKRFDEALEFSESRLKMFSNYSSFDAHGFLLLNMERYPEAIVYFKKAIEYEGIRYPRMLAWMAASYARSGNMQEAQKILDEMKGRLTKGEKGSISFFIAVIYSSMNDKKQALQWLTTAYNSHDMEMPWLMTEPQFYNLHNEPEFQQLAKQIGFK